jgi:hydroxypyruvate isomerase
MLQSVGGLVVAGSIGLSQHAHAESTATKGPSVTKGRINQSIAHWCFEVAGDKWNAEKLCQVARELGCKSVELVAVEAYPTVKKYGLTCALCQINTDPAPPFVRGFNNPDHWPKVFKSTENAIDAAAEYGFPNVIAFTGFSAKNPDDPDSPRLSPEEGAKNCVEGLKKIMGYAEKKKVTLCLEMLNTRDDTHPMKGHLGYQGNHLEYCVDIIKKVGSPRMKLLFDVYHVQIMDGDIIRHIRQYKDCIGHVHVAGNPGRNELDSAQEIYFPAVMRALLDIGYTGYVGHEYIPTRNPYQGLREAMTLCDV